MDNINNLNNNLSNNYNRINSANNISNKNKVDSAIQNNNKNAANNLNLSNQAQNTQISNQAVFLYNSNNIKMTNEILLRYLQSLLDMPEDIEKFIEELKLAYNNLDKNNLKSQILTKNIIDIAQLAKFLNENSKIAANKLLNVISNNLNQGINDTTQLRELLTILASIQQNSNPNNLNYLDSLKDLILLYIPISSETFNKTHNNAKQENKEENIKNSSFSIYFETINFSSFTITINELDNALFINLQILETFPLQLFKNSIESFCKKRNIKTLIESRIKKSSNVKQDAKKQNFTINSNGRIEVKMLLCVHCIIETIFRLDNNYKVVKN